MARSSRDGRNDRRYLRLLTARSERHLIFRAAHDLGGRFTTQYSVLVSLESANSTDGPAGCRGPYPADHPRPVPERAFFSLCEILWPSCARFVRRLRRSPTFGPSSRTMTHHYEDRDLHFIDVERGRALLKELEASRSS